METIRERAPYNIAVPGLNRTMQYGNDIMKCKKNKITEFKSYYVVWKLLFYYFNLKNTSSFKSYYVVWKPFPVLMETFLCVKSLNRTMQYGNSLFHCSSFSESFKFKSYYVVWKPFTREAPTCADTGLNRTMQYGNLATTGKKECRKYKFKSYYVVWKRACVVSLFPRFQPV